MKILKIFGIFFLITFAVIALLVLVSFTYHTKKLRQEAIEYPPPGELVKVNGKNIHIFIKGDGKPTLVFLAGHGTSNPTLDFKPLWMRMVDDYRIAVVERSGYGWSEVSNNPKDIDTMLEETRQALDLSGEKGPYVLFPHSMSGLEAIYWAQKYPDEVKAIIGLDPCVPDTIDILPETRRAQLYAMYFFSRIGLSRYMPATDVENNFQLIKSNALTEDEKKQFFAVFYRSALTKDMLREINYLKPNSKTIEEYQAPINTPMYFFISEEQNLKITGWKKSLIDYLSRLTLGKYLQLDTGHYIYYEKAEIIAEEAKVFIDEVK